MTNHKDTKQFSQYYNTVFIKITTSNSRKNVHLKFNTFQWTRIVRWSYPFGLRHVGIPVPIRTAMSDVTVPLRRCNPSRRELQSGFQSRCCSLDSTWLFVELCSYLVLENSKWLNFTLKCLAYPQLIYYFDINFAFTVHSSTQASKVTDLISYFKVSKSRIFNLDWAR